MSICGSLRRAGGFLSLSTFLVSSMLAAEQPTELTSDETRAVNSISGEMIWKTVSYLASDEMRGRQTPSPELRIASEFVASRFLDAGLNPLGDDHTCFQTHQFLMTHPPAEVSLLVDEQQPLKSLGILTGGTHPLKLTATLLTEPQAMSTVAPECVVIDKLAVPPRAVDNPRLVLLTLYRRTLALTRKGVKLVLLKCEHGDPLLEVAHKLSEVPTAAADGIQTKCAVVLVSAATDFSGHRITATVGAQRKLNEPVRNVLGVLRGVDDVLSSEAILVTAHLDHIGTLSRGDDRVYNGADDNASGVTAVLALADAFASLELRPRRSIVFATFWGEEKGLLGSKAFVQKPLWPLDHITANVNIEMVGRPEPDAREKVWMTGWRHSNLGELMNAGSQRVNVEIFNRTDVGEMLYTRSDNASFVRRGVVAHSFSAGSLHADYHQPGDEWEKLDIPHMTKVLQGLFCGILHVANSDDGPKATP